MLVLLMSFLFSASLRSDPDLPSLLLQFCKQVVDGLVCLAGKSFVHRDIGARNILLDKELNCKISDFGMTREVESETYYGRQECKDPNKVDSTGGHFVQEVQHQQ